MMTREEILSIESYCAEHNVTHKRRLEELSIPLWNFYKAKKKYHAEDEAGKDSGFVQLTSGGEFLPALMPAPRTSGRSSAATKRGSSSGPLPESYLTVELRTPSGTAMRIQGSMTAGHLREILLASGSNA
jgi:hypothetical protein